MYLSPVTATKTAWRSVRASRARRNRCNQNRHPSVCSDSETESSLHALEDLQLSVPTPKKWSLPLPIPPRGSESDSTSSSWSNRSPEEETEDERSPLPSPCPSVKSTDYLSKEPIQTENEVPHLKKKKLSKAALTHKLQKLKTTNYGRCKICDTYVYFWGYQCVECELISHKKCLKRMTIMCGKKPLPKKASVIGIELSEMSEDVPVVLVKCAAEIERKSYNRPGIYRMPGAQARVEKLLKSFENGAQLIDVTDVNPNDLSTALKEFLRELRTPVITNDIYKDLIIIGRTYPDRPKKPFDSAAKAEMVNALKVAINKLDNKHQSTLGFLMKHLKYLTDFQKENCMTPSNMGIIFAPTLFRPRNCVNDLYTEVFEAVPQARVIELMITYVKDIFGSNEPSEFDYNQPSTSQSTK